MPDLADILGLSALRSYTKGDARIKIAVLDGAVDLERACFQGANLTRLEPYWSEKIDIDPQYVQAFLEVENSGAKGDEKGEMLIEAIPDEEIRHSLYLRFHASHVVSTICGQPDSPVEGIAPHATVINIPISYSYENFLNPLNLSRAISTAIEQGVNIIHCAACHPTQSGLAHEIIDKAIRQAQAHNILIVAPGGNDKGKCWCIPAVLDNILAVGAMKDTGEPFEFSNFGGKYGMQGILVPGENILGAQPGTDEPIRKHGTSCAAPIVTGVAALLMSLQLSWGASPDAEAVRAALIHSTIPCEAGEVEEPDRCLLGRMNIPGAYTMLTGEALEPLVLQPSSRQEDNTALDVDTQLPVEFKEITHHTPEVIVTGSNTKEKEKESTLTTSAQDSDHSRSDQQPITPQITPSQSEVVPSIRSKLLYVLGTLGYDFGTEARRDTFKQFMPPVAIGDIQVPANPYDPRQMVDYLETNLPETKSLIWTINLELTPIYALEPVGAFAANIYEVMQYMLAGQVLPVDDEDYIERVSIPGHITNRSIRLFSGQIVPVIEVNTPRGMYGWKVNTLVESALQGMGMEIEGTDTARVRRTLSSFLNRVYYDLRNLGHTARDRALNFAATNVFQAVQTVSEAVAIGMELHSIDVEKSPFCRYGSECWDVKLKFFDPENDLRAKKVFRFTIDVSDQTPVTLGQVRSWSVS